jgi:hypothetical protein
MFYKTAGLMFPMIKISEGGFPLSCTGYYGRKWHSPFKRSQANKLLPENFQAPLLMAKKYARVTLITRWTPKRKYIG